MSAKSVSVLIVGGGIIGCSVAYFLSQRANYSVTLVERCTTVGQCASGKAGGFLARDWCSGPMSDFASKSFDLHEKMATIFGASTINYRKLDTLSVMVQGANHPKHTLLPDWMNSSNVSSVTTIGNTSNTAQVHPEKLTNAFMNAAQQNGANFMTGVTVSGLTTKESKVIGVTLTDQRTLSADVIVLCLGPWTDSAASWVPKQVGAVFRSVYGLKAHSVVFKPSNPSKITPHAMFLQMHNMDPEIYPRPDGTVYICGISESVKVPSDPMEVMPRPDACNKLVSFGKNMSNELANAEVVASQACFLPCTTSDGYPVIGKIPELENLYMATGHSCWGILNAPMTGLALSELICDGKCSSVNLSQLSPQRFVK